MTNSKKLNPIKWGLIFSWILIVSILVISLFAIYDAIFDQQEKLDAYGYTWLAFAGFNLVLKNRRGKMKKLNNFIAMLALLVAPNFVACQGTYQSQDGRVDRRYPGKSDAGTERSGRKWYRVC